ncbi:MAG TPA: hydroxymethylglutaryl-CoA reductase [Gammaproteobacteria bacterium]|nr:hydroxymethylglutaryl-CoA reductase [Gammaproteobacteria bacterium]HRA42564.1 hydroxymethylglutaryl-CoA reductase [Gammaproteobacteria bacterium]
MKKLPVYAEIPMRMIGPVKITGPILQEDVSVPLATFETPLWPSVNRGALVSKLSGGIKSVVVEESMTRSVVVEGVDAEYVSHVAATLKDYKDELKAVVTTTSHFARLEDWHVQIVGNLLYIRFSMSTGDASGHNMTTKAADALLDWILKHFPKLCYVSISGNYCTDKKASAVNGILGRGKYVVCEMTVSRDICERTLRTTPEKMVNLHIKKNLIGTMLAGAIRSANAHFANMLLALYLATGQDAANIIEGSQGMVHAEVRNQDLYFSVTLPNVIVGTVGNGKHLPFVKENLAGLGCLEPRTPGQNSRRLAAIVGATVLCGELSLLAAQTNPGELMESHLRLERLESKKVEQKI